MPPTISTKSTTAQKSTVTYFVIFKSRFMFNILIALVAPPVAYAELHFLIEPFDKSSNVSLYTETSFTSFVSLFKLAIIIVSVFAFRVTSPLRESLPNRTKLVYPFPTFSSKSLMIISPSGIVSTLSFEYKLLIYNTPARNKHISIIMKTVNAFCHPFMRVNHPKNFCFLFALLRLLICFLLLLVIYTTLF